jgi:DNA invertase Pin-like site-specific DNA recombinase
VAAKLDRVSRDVIDFASLLRDADRQGWSVLVLDLQLDTTTPAGRFTAITMANAAEFERRQIGERTRVALAAKKARGARLGRPRQTPDMIVQRVVAEREAGATWQLIADGLNEDAVPTQRGGTSWRVSTVQRLYASHHLDREAAAAGQRLEPPTP